MDRAPRITHLAWGEMEVEGLSPGDDMKLWPGGGRAWHWNETGTHHVPVHVLETREAAKVYNELATQGAAVGGLFHSTC